MLHVLKNYRRRNAAVALGDHLVEFVNGPPGGIVATTKEWVRRFGSWMGFKKVFVSGEAHNEEGLAHRWENGDQFTAVAAGRNHGPEARCASF